MYELIQVTAQYSNSVLLVLLPFIGDFVKQTDSGFHYLLPSSKSNSSNVIQEKGMSADLFC